jgi:hypothetical protein
MSCGLPAGRVQNVAPSAGTFLGYSVRNSEGTSVGVLSRTAWSR